MFLVLVDENEDELDHIMTRAVNKYTADKKSEERYHFKESFNDSINERGINTKEELAVLAAFNKPSTLSFASDIDKSSKDRLNNCLYAD